MPARKETLRKSIENDVESAKKSPASSESGVSKVKEFFAAEDEEAVNRDSQTDYSTFLEISQRLGQTLSSFVKSETSESKNHLMEKCLIDILVLRRLNKMAHFRNKRKRDNVSDARQKVDEQYLQLQNLLYEVSHVEKEVTRCTEFKSAHEDIDLIPLGQFYAEAPSTLTKPETTKHDPHQQRVARLNWELETRKMLSEQLEKVQAEKEEIEKDVESKMLQLDTLEPKLTTLLEASRPLQELLDMNYEKEALQREMARYLPKPLFYAYIQGVAYKEVFDKNFLVTIEGDVEKVKKRQDEIIGEPVESDSDSDSGESQATSKAEKKKKKRRRTVSEAVNEHVDDLLSFHPLHLEFKINCKNKATIIVHLFFLPNLEIVTVKSRLELMADIPRAVASANDLLSDDTMLLDIFNHDSGLLCPNPIGVIKLEHFSTNFASKVDEIGRPYRWAQMIAGLNFVNDSTDPITPIPGNNGCPDNGGTTPLYRCHSSSLTNKDKVEGCNHLQNVLKSIRHRVFARLALQEQISSFEMLNLQIPKEVSSWFSDKVLCQFTSWKSLTYEDYMNMSSTRKFRDTISIADDGWFFFASLERRSAKCTSLIYINCDYPNRPPLFSLSLEHSLSSPPSVVTSETSNYLLSLEQDLNVHCVEQIPRHVSVHLLCIQLQYLMSRLDIALEVECQELKSSEFSREHLYTRSRSRFHVCSGLFDEKHDDKKHDDKKHDDRKKPDSSWFSKLLGVQSNVQPMKAAHSSLLSNKDFVYEIVTHDVQPALMGDYLKLYEQFAEVVKKKNLPAEIAGSWSVAIGNQDQAVHLWRHKEGFEGTDKIMDALLTDPDLRRLHNEQAKMTKKRKNCLILAFSYWGDPTPRPPTNIYELRSYVLRAGTMIEWGNNWARGINYRRDFNQNVAGFFTQVGRLYMVFHFWAYKNLATRKKIREETWQKPGWDTNVAYTVPLIRKMESKIMIPNSFSPLK